MSGETVRGNAVSRISNTEPLLPNFDTFYALSKIEKSQLVSHESNVTPPINGTAFAWSTIRPRTGRSLMFPPCSLP
jgi:hypothetical protein